jgi:uncharacterized coiled-coil DUF342 family protein
LSDNSMYPRCHHPWNLEPYYSRHVSAMTAEGLHGKAEIAEQLAWRDKQIAELIRENEVLRSNSDHLSCENTSLSQQCDAMAEYIEQLAESAARIAELEAELREANAHVEMGDAQIESLEGQLMFARCELADVKRVTELGRDLGMHCVFVDLPQCPQHGDKEEG